MRTQNVLEFIHRRPFQPFRVTLTDGRTYDIHHPELGMVGRSAMVIGLPAPNDPEPVYDRAVTVSLLHIMQVQTLETPASPQTN